MEGKFIFSILQESHEGPIGEDWKYWVEAKVFNQGLKGQGKISVKKHSLPDGTTQEPFGNPSPIVISAGECGLPIKIKLTLEATEVDFFRSDVGITNNDLHLQLPSVGDDPLVHEHEISVGVIETPAITGESSVVTIKVRLEFICPEQ